MLACQMHSADFVSGLILVLGRVGHSRAQKRDRENEGRNLAARPLDFSTRLGAGAKGTARLRCNRPPRPPSLPPCLPLP